MSYNIGLNIVETDGRATPSIQPAKTSVAAFIIRSQRGLPGNVYQVTNWTEFQEHFGSFTDGAYGAYAVQGFFDNGGTMAYVTRAVKTGRESKPIPAMAVTQNDATWDVSGINDPLQIEVDGESVRVAFKELSPAELVSKIEGTGFDIAAIGEFSLWVNKQEYTYTFEQRDFKNWQKATAKEIAAVLNREIPAIQAWAEVEEDVEGKPAKLHLRTDIKGVGATLKAGEKLVSSLGFPSEAFGGNIAMLNAVTPDEVVEALSAALQGKPVSVARADSKVIITHNLGGSGRQIGVPAGDAKDVFGFKCEPGRDGDPIQEALPATRTFGNLTVTAGYRGNTDPGLWGEKIGISIARNKNDSKKDPDPPDRYDLYVEYDGKLVEAHEDLNPDSTDPKTGRDPEKVINDPFSGSKFITVAVDKSKPNPPVSSKNNLGPSDFTEIKNMTYLRLRQGADDGLNSSEDELQALFKGGLKLFDTKEIQLVCCPESHHKTWVTAALAYCWNRGDCMFVGHTPFKMGVADVPDQYSKQFQGDNVYGALYFPWIQVADPRGKPVMIPPTGHVMGIYARTERERGIWKAPAGNAAKVYGAQDVEQHITDVQHTSLVKDGSVNAVRFISGKGIVIDSSRTLSTGTLWLYVNVRLLFNFVKSSLKSGLRWVVQEPNNDTLWNKIKYNSVTPFLMGLWRQGAFGPGSPEQVFTVKVDAENNPGTNIQQGILTVEVYFYPSRPAETIIVTVGQQEGGATASEK